MAVPQRTLTLLRRLARRNGATADATVQAIAASWSAGWADLSPAWQQAIAAIVEQYQRTGVWPSGWQIARIEAIAQAQERTERALTGLLTGAVSSTRGAVADIGEATRTAEPDIIASQRAGLEVNRPRERAAAAVVRDRQARVSALHRPIRAASVNAISRAFRRPATAPELVDKVRLGFASAAVRADTIARTETIDTYRDTAGLVHDENRRILTAWAWHCSCDRRSCPACWAMHGRQFALDVPGPAGHPSCRCTRLPLIAGADLPSAEARFRRLPRQDQLAILGPARLEMFRAGRIGWSDLAVERANAGWRNSWTPRSVADLERLAA